jgi:hypothetical protein
LARGNAAAGTAAGRHEPSSHPRIAPSIRRWRPQGNRTEAAKTGIRRRLPPAANDAI